jgi:hypothetical protein
VHKLKVQLWAILVRTNDGREYFARSASDPGPGYENHMPALFDTKKFAEIVLTTQKIFPKGKTRVVPVIIEVREVSKTGALRSKKKSARK